MNLDVSGGIDDDYWICRSLRKMHTDDKMVQFANGYVRQKYSSKLDIDDDNNLWYNLGKIYYISQQ